MTAWYNEIDPYAADWLRNLIAAGHIAPGVVDERDIRDVRPDELRGYVQCHFFAGIGVWSYALRAAGWPDDRPIWTGSCPCQPFSAAGGRGGFDDERHLWPAFHWLVERCRPPIVAGEQVASKDGLAWLDLVQADLEGSGYASGAVDLCAAGVGAPHIRQRLWWTAVRMADRHGYGRDQGRRGQPTPRDDGPFGDRALGGLADSSSARLEGQDTRTVGQDTRTVGHECSPAERSVGTSGLADAGHRSRRDDRKLPSPSFPHEREAPSERRNVLARAIAYRDANDRTEPTNSFWRDADWLFCRDGKWRPVEPGTFPLAHGAAARVGRLRAYGNAIVGPAAEAFVDAMIHATGGDLA